jgi:predicted ATPase/serine/threonine protein kinase
MTPERWNLVTELFHRACDLPSGDRAAFLEASCGDDAELRREVESLLGENEQEDSFLEAPPALTESLAPELVVRPQEIDPILGTVLDEKYRIEARLGKGGMGAVYCATQPSMDRRVAVKVLLGLTDAGDAALARFKREALTVARLRHPNVVALYDFGVASEVGAYLVMEYLEGESLRTTLGGGPPPLGVTLDVMGQMCLALEAVHAAGVVHRDLKPDNVFLQKSSNGTLVKILDFGIAKLVASGSGLTQAGVALGTPMYMAPEQCEARPVDGRSDVYALGCILYELLTGRPPFDGETAAQLMYKHVHTPPPPFRRPRADDAPGGLERVVLRALAKRPEQRFQSARALGEALAAAAAGGATAELAGAGVVGLVDADTSAGSDLPTVVHHTAPKTIPPNNLPEATTSFVGRERDVAAVALALGSSRLLTLTGAGGIGKSRLALRVARDLLDRYDAGVWLVDLAPLSDAEHVPAAIAAVLGVREEPGRPLLATLADSVKTQRMLLMLDNCEHMVEPAAAAAETLLRASAGMRMLVTSREVLGVAGEEVWQVQPLAVKFERTTAEDVLASDAVQLFVERARLVRPGFAPDDRNARTIAEVCRRLDGIPLAIELAAARVKLLSVEQILAKLDDRFRLLTGGSRTTARQQTLRATIDWSYTLLTSEEREMLGRLSVFAGGWGLEAAEAVCAGGRIDELAVMDLLTRLVDKSLVVAEEGEGGGETRYRTLETIRQYAREKLAEAGEEVEWLRAHRAWCTELAERADAGMSTPRQLEWIRILDMEHDNMRAALRWSLSRDPEPSLRLTVLLCYYWLVRGHISEGMKWLEEALALDDGTPSLLRSDALYWMANYAFELDDPERAEAAAEGGLLVRREFDDAQRRARSLTQCGIIATERGRYDYARSVLEEGLVVARQSGSPFNLIHSLHGLARLLEYSGDLSAARSCLEECIDVVHSIGHRIGLVSLAPRLGEVMRLQGDLERAETMLSQALAVAEELEDSGHAGISYLSLGRVAVDRGELDRGMELFAKVIALREVRSNLSGIVDVLESCAQVHALRGELSRALCLAEATTAWWDTHGWVRHRIYQTEMDRWINEIRARMSEEEIADAVARGRAMTLDQAVVYALSEVAGNQ